MDGFLDRGNNIDESIKFSDEHDIDDNVALRIEEVSDQESHPGPGFDGLVIFDDDSGLGAGSHRTVDLRPGNGG